MDRQTLGVLLKYKRMKKKINGRELVRGLCSQSTLARFEMGERNLDFFMIQRLIGRVGMSINKLEFLYAEEHYDVLMAREYIGILLEEKRYEEVKKELDIYRDLENAQGILHEQYLKEVEAILLSECDEKNEKIEYLFWEALELTVKDFKIEKIKDYVLGEEEILLIFMWLRERERKGKIQISEYGGTLITYIEERFEDEEVKANLLSKGYQLIGNSHLKYGKISKALQIALKGENVLTENGLLINLPQTLDRILRLSKGRRQKIYQKYKKMRDSLKEICKEFGFAWDVEEIKIWKNYRSNWGYLMSELLREERDVLGISQETLASKLQIDSKTISRIENGKAKPKRNTLKKIKRYFEMEGDYYGTRIVVEDFTLLDLERKVAKLTAHGVKEEAEEVYCVLKERLSLKYKKNRQYILFMDALFDMHHKRTSPERLLKKYMEAYEITRKGEGLEKLGEYIPSRTEATLICNIAMCYRLSHRMDEGIGILEKAIKTYEKSKIPLKYYYTALIILYESLAISYEEGNYFEEAISLFDQAIRFEIECGRGDHLGHLIASRTYTDDRRRRRAQPKNKEYYRKSYHLYLLYHLNIRAEAIKKVYKQWYDEEID